jgi:type II secretory pathway pseudopilin PulG
VDLGGESGSLLIELLIAMSILAIAIGALMAVYASTILSMRHTSVEGNALTLVDKQVEMFKTRAYSELRITGVPASGDPYVTSPPTNLSAAQKAVVSTGQVTGGTIPAIQTVTGPDNRAYRVDTYVFPLTPNLGQAGVQVTVAVRSVEGGLPGTIRAQAVTAFDVASTQVPEGP